MEDIPLRDPEAGEAPSGATAEVPQPPQNMPPKSESSECRRLTGILAIISLIIAIIVVIAKFAVSSNNASYRLRRSVSGSVHYGELSSQNLPVTSCGRTRSEALSRNCTFDVLAAAWVPPLCYDAELARVSQSKNTTLARLGGSGPFPWWLDGNHTTPIMQDKLWSLDSMVGHTWETFHVAHCLYKWQWLLKATERVKNGEKGVWVHDQVIKTGHIGHCHEIIANQGRRVGAKAEVQFAFGKCARLNPIGG